MIALMTWKKRSLTLNIGLRHRDSRETPPAAKPGGEGERLNRPPHAKSELRSVCLVAKPVLNAPALLAVAFCGNEGFPSQLARLHLLYSAQVLLQAVVWWFW
jgi:hypothetical protein